MSEKKTEKTTIDVDFLEDKIFKILLRKHSETPKHQIKRFPSESRPDRLNFACPVCGDSEKRVNEKRGNLYLKNTMFVCYNCDTRMSFVKLCETFDERIEMEDKIKLYKYIDDNMVYSKANDYAITALEKLIPLTDWITKMNSMKNSWLVDIKPVTVNSKVFNYLKYTRNITNYENIFQGTYRVIRDGDVVFKTDVMISLNRGGERLLGIQLRNLADNKANRFYKIVEFEKLYNDYNDSELDPEEAIMYNKLSHFYNILNVNFDRTVTVFEGFLDSLFYPNSVGLVGANNDNDILKFLTEADDGISLEFFYDNDNKGYEKAQKMIKNGHQVFLWRKLFENLLTRASNPERYKKILEGIVDLNDLVLASKNANVFETLKLKKFFSRDIFDSSFLEKIKKKVIILEEKKETNFSSVSFDNLRKTL